MNGHATLPPPGTYPVPKRHHRRHVVERGWDGQLWTGEISPAPDGATLPHYHRNPVRFLRNGGWKLFLVFLIATGVATALWATDQHATVVSGKQLVVPVFAGIATLMVMIGLIRLFGRRVGFDSIAPDTRGSIVKWGVGAGILGVAVALAVEFVVPLVISGESPKDQSGGWGALAGPAEEAGKLLLPVILWIKGYFRKPREGFLLVLVSAATFGTIESIEYGARPDQWQFLRPLLEIMHPLFTGLAAAVAWPLAWKHGKFFTGAALGAWAVAVILHSTNDVIILDHAATGPLASITFIAIAIAYLLQKHFAREMVPPDRVATVAPHWRPISPRHTTPLAAGPNRADGRPLETAGPPAGGARATRPF